MTKIASYSIPERILRAAVFQFATNKNSLEGYLIKAFKMLSQCTLTPSNEFNEIRAQKSLERFTELGAEISFVKPKDNLASLQMMKLYGKQLEGRLEKLGAKWEKMIIIEKGKEKEILAIKPPSESSKDWEDFEENLLWLKWKKSDVLPVGSDLPEKVIITCENADWIEEKDSFQKLFLNAPIHFASFLMLPRIAGFYLGMKQNICFYDPRGKAFSKGIPTEAGYYYDILAIYNAIKSDFEPKDIWVTGTCGGVFSAGYLKTQLHSEGINFISENGSINLKKDWFDTQPWPARLFANYFTSALFSRTNGFNVIPDEDKPHENGFNIEELWHLLPKTTGKILVINVKNDQRLPTEAAQRMVVLAEKINQHVKFIEFISPDKDPHSDRLVNHPTECADAISFIFSRDQ